MRPCGAARSSTRRSAARKPTGARTRDASPSQVGAGNNGGNVINFEISADRLNAFFRERYPDVHLKQEYGGGDLCHMDDPQRWCELAESWGLDGLIPCDGYVTDEGHYRFVVVDQTKFNECGIRNYGSC
jgi:hypothetical protein